MNISLNAIKWCETLLIRLDSRFSPFLFTISQKSFYYRHCANTHTHTQCTGNKQFQLSKELLPSNSGTFSLSLVCERWLETYFYEYYFHQDYFVFHNVVVTTRTKTTEIGHRIECAFHNLLLSFECAQLLSIFPNSKIVNRLLCNFVFLFASINRFI